jgi:hypothetical protein
MALIRLRNSGRVEFLANLRPAPAAPPAGGSIALWVWLVVALAVVVVAGLVVSSRR